jgi:hypothetical protein
MFGVEESIGVPMSQEEGMEQAIEALTSIKRTVGKVAAVKVDEVLEMLKYRKLNPK